MIKALILDFDGVVVDSVDIKTDAFRELFQKYENVDDIIQYHLQNNAISRFTKFRYIYENFLGQEYNEETEKELGERFSELVFRKVVQCPFVVGVEEFLQTFSKTHPIYIVSATPQEELQTIVAKRNMRSYFKEVWGTPATKADLIRRALENERAAPTEVIYIGDMLEDFKIAQKIGVLFVGRRSKESFDGLNIPQFPNLFGIKTWVQNRIDEDLLKCQE